MRVADCHFVSKIELQTAAAQTEKYSIAALMRIKNVAETQAQTDLGLLDEQELARPSPSLRDTSSVTYAEIRPGTHTPCVGRVTVQAGFLTRGSLSCLRLPGREPSGNMEKDSPLTVAGAAPGLAALRRLTGFPC